MKTSTLAYINLLLSAAFTLVYATLAGNEGSNDDRVRLVYITTATPESVDALAMANACAAIKKDWNCEVSLVYTQGNSAALARALKRAVATEPDGISLPGNAEDELVLTFVVEARRKGITVTFHTTPMRSAQTRFINGGTGFVGDRGEYLGSLLTQAAFERLSVTPEEPIMVVHTAAGVAPDSRLKGCLDRVHAQNIEPEVLLAAPVDVDSEDMVPDPVLAARLQAGPLPSVIFWDAGPVIQLANLLDSIGADFNRVSVISLDPSGENLGDNVARYVKFKALEQPFLTCYLSLVQLQLTKKYGVPGLEIPVGGV